MLAAASGDEWLPVGIDVITGSNGVGSDVLDDRIDECHIVVGFLRYPQMVADTEPELEKGRLWISLAEPL